MRRIPLLFVVGNRTDASGVVRHVEELRGDFDCRIFFTSERFRRESEDLFDAGAIVVVPDVPPKAMTWLERLALRTLGKDHRYSRRLKERRAEASVLRERRAYRRWCRALARSLRRGVIVTPTDRRLGSEGIVFYEARRQGVPIVTLPVALPAFAQTLLAAKSASSSKHTIGSDARASFPLHERESRGHKVAFFRRKDYDAFLSYLTARERTDPLLRATDPWTMGEMWGDRTLIPSAAIAADLRDGGANPEKLRVVGSPAFDRLADAGARRQDLRSERGFDPAQTVVAWAVHQHYEQNRISLPESLEIVEGIRDLLSRREVPILCSLHPKMPLERYARALEAPNLTVDPARLETWLPVADLAVISAYSSTAYWSVSCGIPTILYDLLDRGDHPMQSIPGIRFVSSYEALDAAVGTALAGGEDWLRWKREAVSASPTYRAPTQGSRLLIRDALVTLATRRRSRFPLF